MNIAEFEKLLKEANMKPIEAIMSVGSKHIHYFVAYDEKEDSYYVYDMNGQAFKYAVADGEDINVIPFSLKRIDAGPIKERALPCV